MDGVRVAAFRREGPERRRVAVLTLPALLVYSEADYLCDPPDAVALKEVREICEQLRQLPPIDSGRVGNIEWVDLRVTPIAGEG